MQGPRLADARSLFGGPLQDWSTYVGHGIESWTRLGDDHGRRQVGMNFMLNVARLDPNAFEVRVR